MCYSCWCDAGKPAIDNRLVRAAVAAMEAVYKYNAVGGRLHAVLDDWNVEDEHLELAQMDPDSPEQDRAERHCQALLKAMSIDERYSALALQEELWESGGIDKPA